MSAVLSEGFKLLVVSDTAMISGTNSAYEPVVRELDAISEHFDEIVWLGYGFKTCKSATKAPQSRKIRLVNMPPSGGKGLLSKIKILFLYPIYLLYILKFLKGKTHVHTRAPSHPALLALLISKWDKNRIYWHKYAGNWIEPRPPKMYGIQRSLLSEVRRENIFGTINGNWPDQQRHLITFENPCITSAELSRARNSINRKRFDGQLSILYVGALSSFKGVKELALAVQSISQQRFKELIIAGDGDLMKELSEIANISNFPVKLVGFQNRRELELYYQEAHIIALPSKSEGFPKVISEGCAYGCIPLVTSVSSIDQYIKHGQNGFLLQNNGIEIISSCLNEIAQHHDLANISKQAAATADIFTYEYFSEKLRKLIIESKKTA